MGLSRQEYWSGWPCPPPGDLPNPGIEPMCLMFPALVSGLFTTSATWEAPSFVAQLVKTPPAMQETWVQSLVEQVVPGIHFHINKKC